MSLLSTLSNVHVSTLPRPGALTRPIYQELLSVMRGQGGRGVSDAELMRKTPEQLKMDRQNWMQKLSRAEVALHRHPKFAGYYRKYFVDESFATETLTVPMDVTPSVWAMKVIAAYRGGEGVA
jgi:hypothetical protein